MNREQLREMVIIPGAIILAGLILAIATYYVRTAHLAHPGTPTAVDIQSVMQPISPLDHIIGKPDASVVLVEYSDIDSQYSKNFQRTMEQVMTEYGPGGKVAWVFRHFPLENTYDNDETHAEAAECVASLGSPDSFWRFIDVVQALAPGDAQFDPSRYPMIVTGLGIKDTDFEACMNTHSFAQRVDDQLTNANELGADGAPFTILLVKGQKPASISGALSYAAMKKIIDDSIAKAQ